MTDGQHSQGIHRGIEARIRICSCLERSAKMSGPSMRQYVRHLQMLKVNKPTYGFALMRQYLCQAILWTLLELTLSRKLAFTLN